MTPLSARLKQYIAVRRSLGYDLSFSARVLRRFAEFADSEHVDQITVELFLRWKKHHGSANSYTWSRRLSMVRVFASWLQGFDPPSSKGSDYADISRPCPMTQAGSRGKRGIIPKSA